MSLRVLLLAAVGIALGEAAAIPTPTTSACPAYVTQVAQVLLLYPRLRDPKTDSIALV